MTTLFIPSFGTMTKGQRLHVEDSIREKNDLPPMPRIAFISKDGKRQIIRETQPGSEHERRLLKRRAAHRFS